MTYSESAQGVIIHPKRAFQELAKHGILPGSDEYSDFVEWLGQRETIDAADVLEWLGY